MRNTCKITIILLLVLMTASCTIQPTNYKSGGAETDCDLIRETLSFPPRTCTEALVGGSLITTCTSSVMTIPFNDGTGTTNYGPITWIVETIRQIMTTATQAVFNSLGGNVSYVGIIQAALTLVVMFYAAAVMMGVVAVNPYSVVLVAIKILLVFELTTNFAFLQELVIDTFEGLVNGLTEGFSGVMDNDLVANPNGSTVPTTAPAVQGNTFAVMDNLLSMIFSINFFKLLFALLATGYGGFIFFVMLGFFAYVYLVTIIAAVKIFIMALIGRFLLYALAPIFIAFALFSQTKSLFDGWLQQLISYSLQPVFLFAFIGLFHTMITNDISRILTSATQVVCYREYTGELLVQLYWYQLGAATVAQPAIGGWNPNIPLNLWVLLGMIISTLLMKGMMDWTVSVAGLLSGGMISAAGIAITGGSQFKQGLVQDSTALAAGAAGAGGAALFGTRTAGGGTFNRTGGLLNPGKGRGGVLGKPLRSAARGGAGGFNAGKKVRKEAVDRS